MVHNPAQSAHVVIIGAGFGGLSALRVLGRSNAVRITLVDRQNYHLFQPLIYQVAIGGLEAPQVAYPVRAILRRYPNATFRMAQVTSIDRDRRRIHLDDGHLDYDYLIVGLGTRTADYGVPGVAEHAIGLKSLSDALIIRDRLLIACEQAVQTLDPARRQMLLSFIVVGGGATGVELAGALAEVRGHVIARDYRELSMHDVRIVLLEGRDSLLSFLDPRLSDYTLQLLRRRGVTVRLQASVRSVDAEGVWLMTGERVAAGTVIWTAGVHGVVLPGLPPTIKGERIRTTDYLNLAESPDVYVVGDMNYLERESGTPLPQVAPVALQQGRHAARNILRSLARSPQTAFRYFDKGNLVALGRNAAVAEVGGFRLRGWIAWMTWLMVHIYYLIGFRNRLMVMLNWAYSYFTYDFAVRIIHGGRPGVHNPPRQADRPG